jgi:thymidine phosphorylase
MNQDEEFEARRTAAAEVTARLRGRGITVTGSEKAEELADLLSAVERFEAAVEAHGGDLMVDDLKSAQPDDRHFVVPRRAHGEVTRTYIGRIDEATARLRRHPPQPD